MQWRREGDFRTVTGEWASQYKLMVSKFFRIFRVSQSEKKFFRENFLSYLNHSIGKMDS